MNLIDLARTVPTGSCFLASKDCLCGDESWELLLTSPSTFLMRDVAYSLAHGHRGHGNRLRYVIVSGQTAETLYGPFCSIYDHEVRSARIVDNPDDFS